MSDSVRSHRQKPTRLPGPWDSPGKNTGVGCHFLLQCMKVKSESEVTLPMPNKSSPVSQIFLNSSYSLYLFHNNRYTPISQRKTIYPSNTYHSLVLSNHLPTYLPFHKPSHPLTFCLSLTLLSIQLFLHPSTYLSSCPIHPLTLPSICLYTHPFHPSLHSPLHQ